MFEIKDPFCPIFQLGYILSKTETDPKEKYSMLTKVNINSDINQYCE